ncbi:caspase family protein, partial [Bradyrhizobium sp. sGM-13]|uniref:caspase family protein n=1 Tax=Bradyrhizobium sp. sGM-13 TaxID=2831781 RepID=UPI001BCF3F9D
IGIDQYPHFPPDWQLEGCGHDVAVLRDALGRRFGFRDDQIAVLRDEQATREGILAAMESLVHRAGKDDEVVFFYSGHG